MKEVSSYATTRARAVDVSYGQIEAAAHAILLTGIRPTVDGVRDALKSGSQRTLLNGLQRFWKDLGERLAEVPDSRRRLPAAVANLADSIWQTALTLATEAANGSDTAMKAQLAQLRTETEVRGHALAQREIEIDSLIRSRERTIQELQEHLRATMVMLNKREATIGALESRLTAALAETDSYRRRLAAVVVRAVKRHRPAAGPIKRLPAPPKRASQLGRSTRPPTRRRVVPKTSAVKRNKFAGRKRL